MANKAHPVRGFLSIATATLLWGISATLGRAVFTGKLISSASSWHAIDPLILAQSRTTISFLVLLPILLFRRGGKRLALPAGDLRDVLLLGTVGVAASNYFYYLAIQKTNVATAILLQYTAPIWVLLYMVVRGFEKATLVRFVSVILATMGSALAIGVIGTGRFRADTLGLLAAVLAAFSFAFYNVSGHRLLARYDRWKVLLYALASAACFWIIVNPPWKIAAAHYGRNSWLFLLLFALTSVLLPFSLYFRGLQHLEATSAVVASCLEPVFSIVLSALILGEGMRPLQAMGMVVVLVAIILVQRPDRMAKQPSTILEPME